MWCYICYIFKMYFLTVHYWLLPPLCIFCTSWGIPQSQLGDVPKSQMGDTPVPVGGGYPSPSQGYPSPRQGVPQSQPWYTTVPAVGGKPNPGQGGYPSPSWGYPSPQLWGYSRPSQGVTQSQMGALPMWPIPACKVNVPSVVFKLQVSYPPVSCSLVPCPMQFWIMLQSIMGCC